VPFLGKRLLRHHDSLTQAWASVAQAYRSDAMQISTLPDEWRAAMGGASADEAVARAADAACERASKGAEVYPPPDLFLEALKLTPPAEVKAVIIGQDPYHGPGQAHGLAFSVRHGVTVPPSLRNVFKELSADMGIRAPGHGNLEAWARRGVLLLNTCLSVERGRPGSHSDIGWEEVTDLVVRACASGPPAAFLLWGAHARAKAGYVDGMRHLVHVSAHPSPFSAKNFHGSKPFSSANRFLSSVGREPLDWTA
jgi:uracil-DNA glycosylase